MPEACFLVPYFNTERLVLDAIRAAPCIYSFEGCHAVLRVAMGNPEAVAERLGEGARVHRGIVFYSRDFDDGQFDATFAATFHELDVPIFPFRFVWAWGRPEELRDAEAVLGRPVTFDPRISLQAQHGADRHMRHANPCHG
jgi:hypothetical protein